MHMSGNARIPTVDGGFVRLSAVAKLTCFAREKSTHFFVAEWKPLIDSLKGADNNELYICGFRDGGVQFSRKITLNRN